MDTLKTYYLLTKPGIIFGNVITIAGGFALATTGHFDYVLFLATLVGLSLLIGSSCILNNYIDRHIDKMMERTKKRPFVLGIVSEKMALLISTLLGIMGVSLLFIFTNYLTVSLALFGYLTYVVLYGFWKRRTHFGTLIGSLAGAVPPVVGYVAVTNRIDYGALILFTLLVVWQMPHFFAIALFRMQDYEAAGIPVHPIEKGIRATKVQMAIYVVAFLGVALLLVPLTGPLYLLVTLSCSVYWLTIGVQGLNRDDHAVWARKMFVISLVTISALFLSMLIS